MGMRMMNSRALHFRLVNISGTNEQSPSPKIYINILHWESMIDVPHCNVLSLKAHVHTTLGKIAFSLCQLSK